MPYTTWTVLDPGRRLRFAPTLGAALACAVIFSGHLLASDRTLRLSDEQSATKAAPAEPRPGEIKIAAASSPPPEVGRLIKPSAVMIVVADARALREKFSRMGYRLAEVRDGRAGVPRLFVRGLPVDLGTLRSVDHRKRLFIKSLLPHVLAVNEAISARRQRLLALKRLIARGEKPGRGDRAWLARVAEEYSGAADDLEGLLRRVDVVPPSLALAQAAAESGWGTSRFAVKGNAVFGQRTWVQGDGLVPGRRDEGARHEVKTFEGLTASVAAYVMNLNRHGAYESFRAKRAELGRAGGRVDADALAGTLMRYAEQGAGYIETLRIIMRVNGLSAFDRARLRAPDTTADIDVGA